MTDLADEMQSDFLFARPSFLEGVARLVDVGGSLNSYNRQRTPEGADLRAIAGDWQAIGHDVTVALDGLRTEVDERP